MPEWEHVPAALPAPEQIPAPSIKIEDSTPEVTPTPSDLAKVKIKIDPESQGMSQVIALARASVPCLSSGWSCQATAAM